MKRRFFFWTQRHGHADIIALAVLLLGFIAVTAALIASRDGDLRYAGQGPGGTDAPADAGPPGQQSLPDPNAALSGSDEDRQTAGRGLSPPGVAAEPGTEGVSEPTGGESEPVSGESEPVSGESEPVRRESQPVGDDEPVSDEPAPAPRRRTLIPRQRATEPPAREPISVEPTAPVAPPEPEIEPPPAEPSPPPPPDDGEEDDGPGDGRDKPDPPKKPKPR